MSRVLLLNHGETDCASQGRYSGQQPAPLTAAGIGQHLRLAERLRDTAIGHVACSDLPACRELAVLLAGPRALQPEYLADLREASFGEWEGLTYVEAMARDRRAMVAFNRDLVHVAPPGGESLETLAARARSRFDLLLEEHGGREGALAIVSHGGALRALLCSLLGIPLARHWTLRADHASLTILDTYPLGPIVERLNDCTHLGTAP